MHLNTTLKWVGALVACLALALVAINHFGIHVSNVIPEISSSPTQADKELRWQEMAKEVESWGDALGMGIDPKIKNTVIVLNLLGFKTEQSCEGHLDRALPYPWVSFNTQDSEIEALSVKFSDIQKQIDDIEISIQKNYPELSVVEANRKEDSPERDALYKELHAIHNEREKKQKLKLLPLYNLLAAFYKGHCAESDVIIFMGPLSRIYSIGGEWQITRDVGEKQLKLTAYQEEMNLFAEFLIDQHYKE